MRFPDLVKYQNMRVQHPNLSISPPILVSNKGAAPISQGYTPSLSLSRGTGTHKLHPRILTENTLTSNSSAPPQLLKITQSCPPTFKNPVTPPSPPSRSQHPQLIFPSHRQNGLHYRRPYVFQAPNSILLNQALE